MKKIYKICVVNHDKIEVYDSETIVIYTIELFDFDLFDQLARDLYASFKQD